LAGPTWYQRFTATIGTRGSRLKITSSPLGSVYFSKAILGMSAADGDALLLRPLQLVKPANARIRTTMRLR
jgi:hypothetical protein